jgi:hypothetical protein
LGRIIVNDETPNTTTSAAKFRTNRVTRGRARLVAPTADGDTYGFSPLLICPQAFIAQRLLQLPSLKGVNFQLVYHLPRACTIRPWPMLSGGTRSARPTLPLLPTGNLACGRSSRLLYP